MILEALGNVLAEAVGILISPLPIVAVILMLLTARSKVNSLLFLAGWVVGIAVVGTIVLAVADGADVSTDSTASDSSGGVLVAIGALLIFLAIRRWRSRPKEGETPTPPKWMAKIDGIGPLAAMALGIALAAVNPKNLLLTVAAAISVGQAGLSTTDTVITWAIFVVLASLGIAIPVIYRLVRGDHAQATLDHAKAWLQANNATVMAVLFLVIGAKILGDGLGAVS